jgi:hypothetical protein
MGLPTIMIVSLGRRSVRLAWLPRVHAHAAMCALCWVCAGAVAAGQCKQAISRGAACSERAVNLQPTRLIRRPPPTRLHSYGVAHLAYFTFGGWLVSKIKDINTFISKSRHGVCLAP